MFLYIIKERLRQLNEDAGSNMSFQQNSANSPLMLNTNNNHIHQNYQAATAQFTNGHTRSYNSTFENNNYKRSIVIPQTLKQTINQIDQELNEHEEIFDGGSSDVNGIDDGNVSLNLNSEAARRLLLLECNRIQTGAPPPSKRSATMLNISNQNSRRGSPPLAHHQQQSSSPLPQSSSIYANQHHNHSSSNLQHSNHNSAAYHNLSSSSSLPPPQQRNVHITSSQSFNLGNNSGNFGNYKEIDLIKKKEKVFFSHTNINKFKLINIFN